MPLANGVAVKPAYEPSARRLAKFLQKASRTNSVALSTPIPRTLERSRIIRSLVSAGVSFATTASRAASTAAICAITSSSLSTSRSMRESPPPVSSPRQAAEDQPVACDGRGEGP